MGNLQNIEKLDELRKEALETRAAILYAELCDKLGIKPEDQLLYEQGYVEFRKREPKKSISKQSPNPHIKNFMKESRTMNIRDYFSAVADKRRLLIEYFPHRFGPEGTQDLKKYSNGQIGKIFEKFIDSYSKSK